MATLVPTITKVGEHSIKAVWGPITSANADGRPLPERWADYGDRSVQITGTFGAGTLHWAGSNDGTNYSPLTDRGATPSTNRRRASSRLGSVG